MGGGVGKFTVAAMINGAGSAIGYELPGNIAQKLIFDAATSRIQLPTTRPAQWIPKDIDEVFFLFIKLFTSPFNSFLTLFADAQTSRHDRIRLNSYPCRLYLRPASAHRWGIWRSITRDCGSIM
jgi:hypothetical protein